MEYTSVLVSAQGVNVAVMLANAFLETTVFLVSTNSYDPVDCGITPPNCFTLLKEEIDAIGGQPRWIALVIVSIERLC